MTGPLAQTLRRLPAGPLAVLPGPADPGQGWIRATGLLGTPLLDDVLDRVRRQVAAAVPAALRDRLPATVPPSYLLGWYLWAVCRGAALPFVHERRVPVLDPGAVALRLAEQGRPLAVALLSPTFACLPDDPDAGHPQARPVADLAGLRATLRAEVAGHVTTFLTAWGNRGGRGRRALWAAATDAFVEAVQGAAPGGPGAREAAALLADGPGPFLGGAAYSGVGLPGAPDEPFRQRLSCCFAYAVPGAEACFSCPRVGDAERARRLATGQ